LTIRKDPPPLVIVAMSDKLHCSHAPPCSHAVKNILRSRSTLVFQIQIIQC